MDRTITLEGWTWTVDIGLYWGEGPDGAREHVVRPTMSSPWWTIGNPKTSDADLTDGAVVLIFPSARAAINHVIAAHRPRPFEAEPTTSYEVWERNLRTGETKRWGGNPGGGYPLRAAQYQVADFNEDQTYHDRHATGPTPTRDWFVVEATTTYKPYVDPTSS